MHYCCLLMYFALSSLNLEATGTYDGPVNPVKIRTPSFTHITFSVTSSEISAGRNTSSAFDVFVSITPIVLLLSNILNDGILLFLALDNMFRLSTVSPAFLDLPYILYFSRRRRELPALLTSTARYRVSRTYPVPRRDILFPVLCL